MSSTSQHRSVGKRRFRVSDQHSSAIHAELQLPLIQGAVLGSMEFQIAGPYAEIFTYGVIGSYGNVTFTTNMPKVPMRYSPTDWLAILARMAEGFVTPARSLSLSMLETSILRERSEALAPADNDAVVDALPIQPIFSSHYVEQTAVKLATQDVAFNMKIPL